MTIKSGSGQACAACKYQRRRCTPECLLAPFFPADEPKMFQNVHRLFGVKNIQNLLKELGPDHTQKAIAMKSIKYHAAMRDKYPVWGCMFEIHQLTYQIQNAEEELQAVLHQLAFYRQQQQQQQHQQQHENQLSSHTPDDYISDLQLGMGPPGNSLEAHSHYNNNNNNEEAAVADYNINYMDFKEMNNVVNSMCGYSNNNSNENNTNSILTHAHLMMQQPPISAVEHEDYNEMQPFFDNIDDSQSYIGSKEVYDQSSLSLESAFKESRHDVEEINENELKNAAACFSLTSVN
ncbi:LOB domain-containing protein 27-like [Salvia hispanica]|uniref:LOB domain-containing protein 27-like n=1 Tax=Salvia hispanica TaxID=49212 RepID=UPI002009B397|nr:LOB domain-containing protein 27-like [Salvia hispanica]